MEVISFSDPLAFKSEVFEFLCEKEAQNCVLLGVIDILLREPNVYPKAYLWLVKDQDGVAGAAWLTPPFPAGLTMMPREAVSKVYAAVEQISVPIRGVAGPNDAASFFADQHHETNGVSTVSTIKQRIFQLERVIRRPMLPGPVRIAVKSDLRLLTEWVQQYSIDCNMAHEVSNALRNAQLMIDAESTFLLVVDGEPVSMVTAKGTTPHGIRISYVYTPAQHRGRGYASAVVADVSQRQLDSGRKFCFLYTDLANPTSNSIYRKIGYYPVSDAVYHTFVSTI